MKIIMWHKWSIFYLNDTGAADTLTKGAVYQEHHDPLCPYWEASRISILDTQMGSTYFP